MLLDELAAVFELDLANLALIEDGGRRARVVAAREDGRDNERLVGQELDLETEPSGISTVTREGQLRSRSSTRRARRSSTSG